MTIQAMMGLLTSQQKLFADKLSKVVIYESSDFSNTSSDDELDALDRKNLNLFVK